MSEIMKSLKKSEQSYQSIHSVPVLPKYYHRDSAGPKNSLIQLVAVACIPAIVAVGYVGFEAQQEWAQKSEAAKLAIEQQAQDNTVQFITVDDLEYPVQQPLKPLSEFKTRFVSSVETSRSVENVDADSPISSISASPTTTQSFESEDNLQLEGLDLSELSPDLAELVQSALQNDASTSQHDSSSVLNRSESTIQLVEHENDYVGKLPAMNLQTHMYTSNQDTRWIKINNTELREGDWLNDQIKLLEIRPQYITIEFEGEKIQIPALYEWKG